MVLCKYCTMHITHCITNTAQCTHPTQAQCTQHSESKTQHTTPKASLLQASLRSNDPFLFRTLNIEQLKQKIQATCTSLSTPSKVVYWLLCNDLFLLHALNYNPNTRYRYHAHYFTSHPTILPAYLQRSISLPFIEQPKHKIQAQCTLLYSLNLSLSTAGSFSVHRATTCFYLFHPLPENLSLFFSCTKVADVTDVAKMSIVHVIFFGDLG